MPRNNRSTTSKPSESAQPAAWRNTTLCMCSVRWFSPHRGPQGLVPPSVYGPSKFITEFVFWQWCMSVGTHPHRWASGRRASTCFTYRRTSSRSSFYYVFVNIYVVIMCLSTSILFIILCVNRRWNVSGVVDFSKNKSPTHKHKFGN